MSENIISDVNSTIDLSSDCRFYFGKCAGHKMLEHLHRATKSIKIVSPYLSAGMVCELLKKDGDKNNKITISLITTYTENVYSEHHDGVRALFNELDDGKDYKVYFNTVFFKTAYFDQKRTSLHQKLYIFDDEIAHMSSFNFTDSGVFDNFETDVTTVNKESVTQIVKYFDELYKTKNLERWDLKNLGKKLFRQQESNKIFWSKQHE